jgi:hypothetical protein
MVRCIGIVVSLATLAALLAHLTAPPVRACCAVFAVGKAVVNADQSVIIIWDAANKTQHFIRRASFKAEADDFGFLVPSPTQPELAEAGDEAFPYLGQLTAPEIIKAPRGMGMGCGCSAAMKDAAPGRAPSVTVLEEKSVAGFHAAVLETKSATALVQWLKDHDYAYSPQVEAWARPYVEAGWKITALKVAKDKGEKDKRTVTASSLRMSFKTDRPLFPYREPDYKNTAEALGAKRRMLRIFFLADARYQGELTKDHSWSGQAVWAGKLAAADRKKLLEQLKLPETTGPAEWYLTEFEDQWVYQLAPADVYFARAATQDSLKRPPHTQYVATPYPRDGSAYALAAVLIVPALWSRFARWRSRRSAERDMP